VEEWLGCMHVHKWISSSRCRQSWGREGGVVGVYLYDVCAYAREGGKEGEGVFVPYRCPPLSPALPLHAPMHASLLGLPLHSPRRVPPSRSCFGG
jgi:hypothetical protein